MNPQTAKREADLLRWYRRQRSSPPEQKPSQKPSPLVQKIQAQPGISEDQQWHLWHDNTQALERMRSRPFDATQVLIQRRKVQDLLDAQLEGESAVIEHQRSLKIIEGQLMLGVAQIKAQITRSEDTAGHSVSAEICRRCLGYYRQALNQLADCLHVILGEISSVTDGCSPDLELIDQAQDVAASAIAIAAEREAEVARVVLAARGERARAHVRSGSGSKKPGKFRHRRKGS
uniref:Uncharacterized protein n=1 Tax=viral metagenome TaxID=1070528 RepID=A0A6H1ZT12_9ZZZZ